MGKVSSFHGGARSAVSRFQITMAWAEAVLYRSDGGLLQISECVLYDVSC